MWCQKRDAWRNGKQVTDWPASLRLYVYPQILVSEIPSAEVGRAVAFIRAARAWAGTKLAFEFLLLTAARSAEVRLETRGEVDRDSAVWTIRGTRMKTRREHRAPPCGRAVEILDEPERLRGDGSAPAPADLLFPSRERRHSPP